MVTRPNVIIALEIARELSLKARDRCLYTHIEVPRAVGKWRRVYYRVSRIGYPSSADYESMNAR
jgi:hypothetical protein